MTLRWKAVIGLALALVAAALGPCATAAARVTLPRGVTPERYDLEVAPEAARGVFAGRVTIALSVEAPTRAITLNAADLAFSSVSLSGMAAPPVVAFDAQAQTATLTFAEPVAAGRHTLSIAYTGKINADAAGLFSLDYDAPAAAGGGRRRALFTQFENSDARRFLPCWDEPNKKAVFALTALVPADAMAVSNMPVASRALLAGSRARVRFAASPRMSTYLLFFGLGDFERIHRDVGGVDVGVIVKRGAASEGRYALDAAADLLPYYSDYFGFRYPLPKLDLIAGSGESQFFGAMENWGAIFFFDRDLLTDPARSTPAERQNVYTVVAHEMAHQWFGDLVTMDWWDDLWLNEGFASWMEVKATDHFHPEWRLWLQAASAKDRAMALDARTGAHPVITPIADVLQAQQAFDAITYEKGEAVIRMLESYVGEDAWRTGVRRYVARHAYANSVTDDLWREVDAVSPRPITAIAHDFTLQPGVPTIRVDASCGSSGGPSGGATLALTQGRYGVDAASRVPLAWRVPVASRLQAVGAPPRRDVVVGAASLDFASCAPVVVNAGQTGYFRTLYAEPAMAALKRRFVALTPADRIGLLDDAAAFGASGEAPVADLLDLAARVTPDDDPVVAATIVERLVELDDRYDPDAVGRRAWRRHARAVVSPLLTELGWSPKPGETDAAALLRVEAIEALGRFDDPAVVAGARHRFARALDPTGGPIGGPSGGLAPSERDVVLRVVAAHADAAEWERLHVLAKSAPSTLEKSADYGLLSQARDPALAERALALALGGEPESTTGPTMIRTVAATHPSLALAFAVAHRAELEARLEPDSRAQYVPRLAAASSDPATIAVLDAYAAAHIPAQAQGEVVKARSAIVFAAAARATMTPQIDRWVAAHRD